MYSFVLADVVFGPIFFLLLTGSLVPLLVALVLESLVLWVIRWAPLRSSLADNAIANLVSAVVGFGFFFLQEELMESLWFWIAAWLASTLLEEFVLWRRRGGTVVRSGVVSLLANTASYVFLVWLMSPIIRQL